MLLESNTADSAGARRDAATWGHKVGWEVLEHRPPALTVLDREHPARLTAKITIEARYLRDLRGAAAGSG